MLTRIGDAQLHAARLGGQQPLSQEAGPLVEAEVAAAERIVPDPDSQRRAPVRARSTARRAFHSTPRVHRTRTGQGRSTSSLLVHLDPAFHDRTRRQLRAAVMGARGTGVVGPSPVIDYATVSQRVSIMPATGGRTSSRHSRA